MANKEKHIEYWLDSAEKNYRSMLNIYQAGEYMWSLFIGHLCIEKLLKALYVKNVDINVPRIHDLLKIAVRMNLELSENRKDKLQVITSFNIEARYDFQRQSIYRKCTEKYTGVIINDIKEMRQWLLNLIND